MPGKSVKIIRPDILKIPGKLSATGLALPERLSVESWQAIGRQLIACGSGIMWWIGDWWAFGEKKAYGERKEFAEALEKAGGFSFTTCMQTGWVSRSIETSRRLEVLPWSFHLEVASLPPAAQDAALAWAAERWPNITVREMRGHARTLKREGDFNPAALPDGKWRVLYADPPWQYGNEMPRGTTTPEEYYPSMPTDEICAMPVAERAMDDAVLFLWCTSPIFSPDAIQVVGSWGFEYKTTFIWDKIKHNMGHYNSMRHEILIVATRGNCTPDERKLFDSVISIERTEHSRKPELFYEIIETLYPFGKRLELFARGQRNGWDSWGNEIKDAA